MSRATSNRFLLLIICIVSFLLSLMVLQSLRPIQWETADHQATQKKQLAPIFPQSDLTHEAPQMDIWETAEYQSKYYCERLFPALRDNVPVMYGFKADVPVYGTPVSMYAYKEHDIVSNFVLNHGGWDMSKAKDMLDTLNTHSKLTNSTKDSVTFIDIGTNIGWFSSVMAHSGYRVLSFEPMPQNELLLRMNMCLQDPERIKQNWVLINKGLGNTTSHCKMYSEPGNFGNGYSVCDDDPMPTGFNFKFRGTMNILKLDDVLDEERLKDLNVGLVKLDVENYEKFVVAGGLKFFASPRVPKLIVEFWGASPTAEVQSRNTYVFNTLKSLGWKISEHGFGAKEVTNFNPAKHWDGYCWKE